MNDDHVGGQLGFHDARIQANIPGENTRVGHHDGRGGTELPSCACLLAHVPTNPNSSGKLNSRLISATRSRRFSHWNGPTFGPGCAWIVGDRLGGDQLGLNAPTTPESSGGGNEGAVKTVAATVVSPEARLTRPR